MSGKRFGAEAQKQRGRAQSRATKKRIAPQPSPYAEPVKATFPAFQPPLLEVLIQKPVNLRANVRDRLGLVKGFPGPSRAHNIPFARALCAPEGAQNGVNVRYVRELCARPSRPTSSVPQIISAP